MGLHGLRAHEQLAPDLFIRESGRDETDDVQLGRSEAVPSRGWTLALTPRALRVGNRRVLVEGLAIAERGFELFVAERGARGGEVCVAQLRLERPAEHVAQIVTQGFGRAGEPGTFDVRLLRG